MGNSKSENRVLMVASVSSMIGQFNMNNIKLLQEMGYEVHVACNMRDRSVWPKERIEKFLIELNQKSITYYQIDFARKPLKFMEHVRAYKQLVKLLNTNRYQFIHCHSPIGGAIARIAGHHTGTKVIYTAHGFHFYKGAPIVNWILYFPVEWICSWFTDILITINQEDYQRAIRFLHAKKVEYVHGIGVDIDKFKTDRIDIKEINKKQQFMKQWGIPYNAKILLSVGELNKNKNHSIVIKALAELKDTTIHYCIAGNGILRDDLMQLANELGIEEQVHLLGYRNDINELLGMADIYLLPSIREGLNVSLMEAMASTLPCICSNIRGNNDLIQEAQGGYRVEYDDVNAWKHAIEKIYNDLGSLREYGKFNRKWIKKFSLQSVLNEMKMVYEEVL